jgi:Mrp family chromosome partitioning ATPase
LPAGRKPPNAAELLTGERFAELLAALETRYDHVIVDGPPVIGLADAPLIASVVRGVVFVIEANSGKVRMVNQSLERLDQVGAKLFGGVVTKLDERNLSYGYGYGYGYEYGSERQAEAA